jgi:hypothetical protein
VGQETAALRDFNPGYDRGGFSTEAAEAARPSSSAVPAEADANSTFWPSSQGANMYGPAARYKMDFQDRRCVQGAGQPRRLD